MGRKRTASYKRKRRARNKARLQALKNMPRDPNRPSRPCRVQFFSDEINWCLILRSLEH